ncbi:MAG: response regulator [Chloroflexi bacterium]|nr:response regulator [Chloroflexota bacterium]
MAKILVADDESSIRRLVQTVFERRGHEVIGAEDGEDAWRLIRVHRPALVLVDLWMPRWSGWDLIRAIKADPTLSDLKVVVLTASTQADDQGRARELGIDDYLTKPFSPRHLRDVVDRVLESSDD